MTDNIAIQQTILLDENTSCTLQEFTQFCNQSLDMVLEMIEEGLIVPASSNRQQWRFGLREIKRAQSAQRLICDLQVNMAGAALALDLLEEIEHLRQQIRQPPRRLL